uniref:Putative xylanase/chitin deacetylase n=1 Tax=Desulfovibrio sp. U5L TaxID=596152 RepID=I2Q326_9BACT
MEPSIRERIRDGLAWRMRPVTRYVSRYRPVFIVQNYHRLFRDTLTTDFDEGVFGGISEEYFRRQLAHLARDYDVLTEREVIDCLGGKGRFPRKALLLTFDDGYKDNFTLAYPVLRDLHLPALFFIPTLPWSSRRLGWWDLIAWCVKKTDRPAVTIDGEARPLGTTAEKAAVIASLLRKFYRLPDAETRDLLETLSRDLDVALPDVAVQSRELMTTAEIREMIEHGMAVGAHTHSHKVLSTLDRETQDREIGTSKKLLEEGLGVTVRSFAYPVGTAHSFDDGTKKLVRDHGFSLAFSFYSGVNDPAGGIDPYDIRRTFRGHPYAGFLESFREPYTFIRPRQ